METLILPAVHLGLILGFIIYKAKAPFVNFMQTRHQDVVAGLNQSKIQAAQAQSKSKELETKMAGLAAQREKIQAEWKEKETLHINAVKESSQRLIQQMRIEAEQNKKALQESFRHETLRGIGMLVVALAEKKIRSQLNAQSHQKVNEQFVQEVAGT